MTTTLEPLQAFDKGLAPWTSLSSHKKKCFSLAITGMLSAPQTITVNDELARKLGFDPQWIRSEQGAQFIVGNQLLEGSEPIAMVYAGHQFGNWVPRLGDGRALLLGGVVADDGLRLAIRPV